MSLFQLPVELLCLIIENLDEEHDLNAFGQTSHLHYDLTNTKLYHSNAMDFDAFALFWGAVFGQPETVKKSLVDRNIKFISTNELSDALVLAVEAGCVETATVLIEKGAEPNGYAHTEGLPITAACKNGHQEMIDLLIQAGIDINPPYLSLRPIQNFYRYWQLLLTCRDDLQRVLDESASYTSPLHAALDNGHEQLAELLILKGANVQQWDIYRNSPLQKASTYGYVAVVRELLDREAYVDQHSNTCGTALQVAVFNEHEEIVDLLLEAGAEPDLRSWSFPENPLYLAAGTGHEGIVSLLLERDAIPNIASGPAGSPIQIAVFHGHAGVVRILLANGANADARPGCYGTPLQAAASGNHTSLVRLLLENGAKVNAHARGSMTALHQASFGGFVEVVRALLAHNANMNIKTEHRCHPLQAASWRGHLEILKLLLEHGASVGAESELWIDAVSAAHSQGRMDAVQLLREHRARWYEGTGGDRTSQR